MTDRALASPPVEFIDMSAAVWQRVDVAHGLGYGHIRGGADGFRLQASEIVHDGGLAYSVAFAVETDAEWATTSVYVEATDSAGSRELGLTRWPDGAWRSQGHDLPNLQGCVDVDVAATPVTNTLPIRRVRLEVGQVADLRMAWVDVPSLQARPSQQRYERLKPADGCDRYVYSDDVYGPYLLTMDQDGLVVDYEGLARRVWQEERPWIRDDQR
ncbi:MAG: putative glycolipid-binding domain-containing protein [Mycobacteriales bacterium]